MTASSPPRWDLSNVYPSLDSAEFQADLERITQQLSELGSCFESQAHNLNAGSETNVLAARFGIDIHQKAFWEESLRMIGRRIERYLEL